MLMVENKKNMKNTKSSILLVHPNPQSRLRGSGFDITLTILTLPIFDGLRVMETSSPAGTTWTGETSGDSTWDTGSSAGSGFRERTVWAAGEGTVWHELL